RIGAREMLGLAALVGAPADMAAAGSLVGGPAHAAITGAAMPVGHAAGIGQDRPLAREQERADLAQVDELAEILQRHVLAGDVDGEIGRALDVAQEDVVVGLVDDGAGHHALQEHRLGIAAGLHQVLLGVDRNEASGARRGKLDHALIVLALMAGTVDFSAGIRVSGSLHRRGRYTQASAWASTSATCTACRFAPSAIWWRQEGPAAKIRASAGALRTAGISDSSAMAIDVS